jgi:hypothetical protein
VLERLSRKGIGWWSVPGRREAAQALAAVWCSRTNAPAGASPTWPKDHGVADLLAVLADDVRRAGEVLDCSELDALERLL